MFGDKLTLDDCRQAIDDLKKCDAPFQCAHGCPWVPLSCSHRGTLQTFHATPKMTMKKLDFSRFNGISF